MVSYRSWLDIGKPCIRVLMAIFVVALLSKGAVLFRGSAIDDYAWMSGVKSEHLQLIISQGRYMTAGIVWVIDSFGVNLSDMYFSLGLVTLFLQAVFVVSILRFVGVENSPSAGLVGAIMVAHPYLTEILSFRMALPFYSAALIFSIIALEMMTRSPEDWRARVLASLATLAMLTTYQVFVNYFAVSIIFAYIYGRVLSNKNGQSLAANNIYRQRAMALTFTSAVSLVAFFLVAWLTKTMGLVRPAGRATFIAYDKIPERIEQTASSLMKIYWTSEPVFSGWLKTLVALMLGISVITIFWHFFTEKSRANYVGNILSAFIGLLLIVPISLGVIVAFDDWWPVPRVLAHVAIIIGLIFLVADSCIQQSGGRFVKSINIISRTLVLVSFIFLSNQILADQQRINRWDNMMANRIVARLELHPNFRNAKLVYINEGSWGFPAKLTTIQGNLNVSAFYPDYSRIPLLSEVSGYRFSRAVGPKAIFGENYCKANQPWPHAESVTVEDDVAIICLKKSS